MTEFTDAISEHVRKGIAAQDVTDRAAGRLTAAERDHEVGSERAGAFAEVLAGVDGRLTGRD